jgi:hypothetical protein
LPDLTPWDYFLFPKMKLQMKGCRFDMEIRRRLSTHFRTSRNAWNGKHTGIAVYMPRGTTSKETVETGSYGKKLLF